MHVSRPGLPPVNGAKLPQIDPSVVMPPAVKSTGEANDVGIEVSVPSVGTLKTKVSGSTANDIAKVVAGAALGIVCFIFGMHHGKKYI